jgi:hypothetical protein
MKTLDLGKQPVTVDELLTSAASETVLIRSKDGHEFVLEAADAFEQEVAEFAASEKFMSFLPRRSKEQASISLAEIEQRLSGEEP